MTRCALEKPEGFTAMTRCALQFLRLLLRKVQLYGVRRQFYDWKLNLNEISIAWGVIGFHFLFPAMSCPPTPNVNGAPIGAPTGAPIGPL